MARGGFAKRGSVKKRAVAFHEGDNKPPLSTGPRTALSEPGQDAEASQYPATASRKKGPKSGSAGIVTRGKGA